MIKVENLSKVFRTEEVETTALNNVNLEIKEGEFVAIMGPSGCGKSTLLNILGMLDSPTHGKYHFCDNEVSSLKEKLRNTFRKGNINFVFQSFNLIDELSVYKNVELPLKYLRYDLGKKKKRVLEMLDRMKIGHRRNHYPQQLSGGQQQRVAIARAIAPNPKLLLADEPTGNLDSKTGLEVMNLLSELNAEGTTIVMVTHSERDAEFAHRVIRLFDGEVTMESTKKELTQIEY
ncbi:ABC transporter ATP-binding protein [Marinifilum flexuosum]|uniref:Putative ABC transport system ATP-binding protein n=1 Tax=Marinifilum flexuosum TaxID=1117708 RepID=A0A419X4D5_9BACT|nr:ABC transporter ATP-binding protein [Marinifilum flexuosum]RKE02575.1 putative ABC transport system ATP-binding protein [Marinifilum flexuosum]